MLLYEYCDRLILAVSCCVEKGELPSALIYLTIVYARLTIVRITTECLRLDYMYGIKCLPCNVNVNRGCQ